MSLPNDAVAVPREGSQFSNPDVDAETARQLLAPTRGRAPVDLGETWNPSHDMSHGDAAQRYFHHPRVPIVAHVEVLEAEPVEMDGRVRTRCTFRALESLKGEPGRTFEAWSWGGTKRDVSTTYYHLPRCAVGERAVAFVAEINGEAWLVGSDSLYAITRDASGVPHAWGDGVLAFARSLREEAP